MDVSNNNLQDQVSEVITHDDAILGVTHDNVSTELGEVREIVPSVEVAQLEPMVINNEEM
jgi:hypothetical protein